jgi:hypothetical protein
MSLVLLMILCIISIEPQRFMMRRKRTVVMILSRVIRSTTLTVQPKRVSFSGCTTWRFHSRRFCRVLFAVLSSKPLRSLEGSRGMIVLDGCYDLEDVLLWWLLG